MEDCLDRESSDRPGLADIKQALEVEVFELEMDRTEEQREEEQRMQKEKEQHKQEEEDDDPEIVATAKRRASEVIPQDRKPNTPLWEFETGDEASSSPAFPPTAFTPARLLKD